MKQLALLLSALALVSCAKDDAAPTPPANPGGGSAGVTIPTTSYWRIDGTSNGSSAEIVSVNGTGNSMGYNKPFPDLGLGYCQLRVFWNSQTVDIRSLVPEGGHITYPITINSGLGTDSIRVELDVQDLDSQTFGNYFYRATGGRVHVSKLNGKLRYTSDGVLSMSGVLYPAMLDYLYSCQLDFSQVEP